MKDLNPITIFITLVIFFTGYFIAPIIYRNNIKLLLIYPIWITKKLNQFLSRKLKFYLIFAIILFFNSSTLFIILISGFVPLLPALLIFWLGINLGISIFHISGKNHYFLVLVNPVAILEIIATTITGNFSIKLSIINLYKTLKVSSPNLASLIDNKTFITALKIFIHYSLPILIIAAIIETVMITLIKRKSERID